MNSLQMKAELAAYWRFKRQMPVVAVEALNEDVIVITRDRKLLIIEIKVSTADLRRDQDKRKHSHIRKALNLLPLAGQEESHATYPESYIPNSFYFAVPEEIAVKASEIVHELYPYAGMIVVSPWSRIPGHSTWVHRQAIELKKKKLSLIKIAYYVKAQSASLANAYAHLARRTENGSPIHQPEGDAVAETQL